MHWWLLTSRGALGGKGPQGRLDEWLEEVAKAVGGGYCPSQMPLKPSTCGHGDGGWVVGWAPWRGGGGTSPPSHAPFCPFGAWRSDGG